MTDFLRLWRLDPDEGGRMRSIHVTVPVQSVPDAVIQAFLDVDAMRRWWGVDRGLVEPQEGGV